MFTLFMKMLEVEYEKKFSEQVYEHIKTYLSSLHIRTGTTNHHRCESLSSFYLKLQLLRRRVVYDTTIYLWYAARELGESNWYICR
jgi:hypothetical protein